MKKIISIIFFIQLLLITKSESQQNEYWLHAGDVALKQSNMQVALKNYNFYIENNPKDPIGYLHRAKLLTATGRETESEMDIKIAQSLNPLSLMYVNPVLRSKYAAKKSYDFKYDDLENAFIKSPSRYKDYEKIFEDLALGHSQDSLIELVIYKLNEKDIEEAEIILNNIEITSINESLIYDLKGKIHLKRMDYDKAIELFSKAININPNFSIAYHNRSLCYKLKGDYNKAEADLKQAIEINSDIGLFYFTIAKLNEKKGNNQLAMDYYSKAIEIDDDYEEALINYGQLLKGLGDYTTALKHINDAISKNPNIIENKFFKANLHFVYGDFDQASDEYHDFLLKYPNDKDALFNKGLSLILLRKVEEGCHQIEQSLEIEEIEKRRNLYGMFCDDFSN